MPEVDLVRQREVVDAFLAATRSGDFDALLALLDPAVELRPDEGAVRMGALRATRGATEVAGLFSRGAAAARLAQAADAAVDASANECGPPDRATAATSRPASSSSPPCNANATTPESTAKPNVPRSSTAYSTGSTLMVRASHPYNHESGRV